MTSAMSIPRLAVLLVGAGLAFAPLPAVQAANWQIVLSDTGRKMEIDRASIHKVEGDKITATARIHLEKPVADAVSGGAYSMIEAHNRYDCNSRSFTTLKRIYFKNDAEVLREEENKAAAELPVRTGTLDDRILKIVCRPSAMAGMKQDFERVVKEANEAAAEMRRANEGLVKKEAQKDQRKEILKADLSEHSSAKSPAKPAGAEGRSTHAAVRPAPARSLAARRSSHAARGNGASEHAHWGYEGVGAPENWARLSPENKRCASGLRQSPIDIRDGIRVDLTPIQFRYQASLFSIVDNGHTVQATIGNHRISLLGKEYPLIQFHFHRPSEERIEGKSFDMVAHLVHRADDGKLAVIAVMLETGRENPLIQTLWNHLPLEKNESVSPPATPIDLNQLLPDDRSYYTYMGSLTTPPCTEDVLWLVMKQPATISPEQLAIFSRLYPHNARPIQATNSRMIKESR